MMINNGRIGVSKYKPDCREVPDMTLIVLEATINMIRLNSNLTTILFERRTKCRVIKSLSEILVLTVMLKCKKCF